MLAIRITPVADAFGGIPGDLFVFTKKIKRNKYTWNGDMFKHCKVGTYIH
jgi:hypothetical protein